ncbi:DNA cytosine methyltransferase [Microbacterium sp. NC79]|uniref:DNA cytosine methyltransferase n=1 Tax=Microbacterium sp. NC79 TaxID=2851009 RepID=UPI001C2BF64E|nr:DNA (cytosine-5-)-methyltransferase [Microbacterium sp. NC79]MBV0895972.1 DNA cytosine methyltransferase [Microbacterium sp. NC79]
MGELFSGPGGIAAGAHAAAKNAGVGLSHLWANDYDRDTVRTYVRNIPGATNSSVRFGDVRELDIESLPSPSGFAFGFPCNDYSLVGESKGLDGDFGPLYKYGARVLQHHQPEWFVAENVSGLRSANDGRDFAIILRELRAAGVGYTLVPHLYKFEEYGVPQRRHRIIIVGVRNDIDVNFRVPAPTHKHRDQWKPVSAVLSDIPRHLANQELTRQSPLVEERLRHIPPGKNVFNTEDLPEHLRLNVRGATLSQIYRRLDPDQPSYTITGSGGGGTHGYHWHEPRALTNRERARIQTFDDDFVFLGSKESVRKQVGMAVPPEGARVIFEALFKSFQGQPYEFVPRNLDDDGLPA